MTIGVLKEGMGENRVALLPEHVAYLVKKEFKLLVEKEAGAGSYAGNEAYAEAGAAIQERAGILKDAEMILCIHPPADKIPQGKTLVAVLGPLANKPAAEKLAKEGVTSFSLDMIPRSTRAQAVDVLSSMATVAGYKAVLVAAGELNKFFPMFMSASGTIKPSRVLILGAGVAGLQALATARNWELLWKYSMYVRQ